MSIRTVYIDKSTRCRSILMGGRIKTEPNKWKTDLWLLEKNTFMRKTPLINSH